MEFEAVLGALRVSDEMFYQTQAPEQKPEKLSKRGGHRDCEFPSLEERLADPTFMGYHPNGIFNVNAMGWITGTSNDYTS